MSFRAWSEMPCTRLAKGGSWYMRIGACFHDVAEQNKRGSQLLQATHNWWQKRAQQMFSNDLT
jgi:hypothetical protein